MAVALGMKEREIKCMLMLLKKKLSTISTMQRCAKGTLKEVAKSRQIKH